ncbi:MAG TPA: universal stress protein [Longimicrobiales bacterium]
MGPAAIRSILVATDLSAGSDTLVRAAAAIAAVVHAKLHIIHAFDFQPLPYIELSDESLPGFARRLAEAEQALRAQVHRSVPDPELVASRHVAVYVAHGAILDRADAVAADLIVLGRHRRRSLAARFLGSTADRVVRTAAVPVLIIGDGLSLPLRRVVAPTDLSEAARAGLDHALAWAATLGAPADGEPRTELRVLHVAPVAYGISGRAAIDERTIAAVIHSEVEAALERVGGASGVERIEDIRWSNEPAAEIVRYAEQEKADLLALGTHGRGAIQRALIGSVASAVARRAPCPVLLVSPALWRTRQEG